MKQGESSISPWMTSSVKMSAFYMINEEHELVRFHVFPLIRSTNHLKVQAEHFLSVNTVKWCHSTENVFGQINVNVHMYYLLFIVLFIISNN